MNNLWSQFPAYKILPFIIDSATTSKKELTWVTNKDNTKMAARGFSFILFGLNGQKTQLWTILPDENNGREEARNRWSIVTFLPAKLFVVINLSTT